MSLRAKFAKAAETIFDAFGDVVESVTYTSLGVQEYNATSGDIEREDTNITCDMVREKLDSEKLRAYATMDSERKKVMMYEWVQGIFRAEQLGVSPKNGDYITRADGAVWMVIDFFTDPAGATWTIVFRK